MFERLKYLFLKICFVYNLNPPIINDVINIVLMTDFLLAACITVRSLWLSWMFDITQILFDIVKRDCLSISTHIHVTANYLQLLLCVLKIKENGITGDPETQNIHTFICVLGLSEKVRLRNSKESEF